MLWKNELTEIRNENAEQISGMNGTMWDQLSPMLEYLSSFSIPMFEEEVIKKDLIGMAKEAEIEPDLSGRKTGNVVERILRQPDRKRNRKNQKKKGGGADSGVGCEFCMVSDCFLAHWGFAGCRTKNGLCIRYVIRIFRSIVRCMASWKTYYGMG